VASYIGETLTAGGRVTAVDQNAREATVDVWIKNEADDIITPGQAVVRFH
jgi:3-methylfumaryl-CoA hydratase